MVNCGQTGQIRSIGNSRKMESRPIYLLDGSSLVFRAFYALPQEMATSGGVFTNAVYGFISMLISILRERQPDGMAVAFDRPEPTFRSTIVSEYKANRAETPEILLPQFALVREFVELLGLPQIDKVGFEADDILATLASRCRNADRDAVIVTGDRDAFQLVEDPHIKVMYTRKGISDVVIYDEQGIVERTGVTPSLYPFMASLRGDPSDNLVGVSGVGDKTAARLAMTYNDPETLFSHLDDLTTKLSSSLAESKERVLKNLEATILVRDLDVEIPIEAMSLGNYDHDGLKELVRDRLEIRSLWERLDGVLRGLGASTISVPSGSSGSSTPSVPPAPFGSSVPSTPPGSSAPSVPPAPSGLSGATGTDADLTNQADVPIPIPDQAPLRYFLHVIDSSTKLPTVQELLDRIASFTDDKGTMVVSSPSSSRIAASPTTDDKGTMVISGVWAEGATPVADLEGSIIVESGLLGVVIGYLTQGESVHDIYYIDNTLLSNVMEHSVLAHALVVHDGKPLFREFLSRGLSIGALRMDTKIGAYLLDPSSGDYSIDSLCDTYLGGKPDINPDIEPDIEPVASEDHPVELPGYLSDSINHVVADTLCTFILSGHLEQLLAKEGMTDLCRDVELPLVEVLARMEYVGIAVDRESLGEISMDLSKRASELADKVQKLVGVSFNVNSTKELRRILYDKDYLALQPGRKTKTGYSTDARTLEKLRDQHPAVDALLEYREMEKLRSTYGERLIQEISTDGRIHATFHQTATRTGRLSSDRPNLHNIPARSDIGRQIRAAFKPGSGYYFVVADYDQIELRIIAHLAGDPGLLAAFHENRDVHTEIAARVYGISASQVTPELRNRAKMVSYGLVYGMETFGLADRLAISNSEAKSILDAYFAAFPGLRNYMDRVIAEARSLGYTRTLTGRRRPLPELMSDNRVVRQAAERQAINAGAQGLAADLFKLALVRLDKALHDMDASSRVVLQVHDEVLIEACPSDGDIIPLVRDVLVSVGDYVGLTVPLAVSIGKGDSWATAKHV